MGTNSAAIAIALNYRCAHASLTASSRLGGLRRQDPRHDPAISEVHPAAPAGVCH
jgi:hypothetical protein